MNPVYYLLSSLVLPIMMLAMLLFALVREIIRIILKLKYGNLFGGFLKSADAVWAIEDVSRSIVNIVVIINMKSDKSNNLTEQIKKRISEKIFKRPDLYTKLTSRRLRMMGFCYLLKNQITVDDCVSTLNLRKEINTLDEALLKEIISERSNKLLPKQNSALWEISVMPKPIQCTVNDEQSTTRFPVLLRFSHIVGDGISLTNLLSKTYSDYDVQESNFLTRMTKNMHSSFLDNKSITGDHILLRLIITVRHIFKFIRIILMAPAIIMHQTFIRKEDVNALHGCKLSGNKTLVYAIEKERKFISLIKKIKESVPESRFSDILLTAISGSLSNYFKSTSLFTPSFITAMVTAVMSGPNVDQNAMQKNNFSVGLLELPILTESKLLKERLQDVMRQMNKLRNSPDYQINYWLLKRFCGVIPLPLLRLAIQTNTITMTVSNLPGIAKFSVLNGYEVEDIIYYTPHRGTVGVGFTILTYDGRLQLGLIVDKIIMDSVKTAQSIVDDIFENINLLYDEVISSNS